MAKLTIKREARTVDWDRPPSLYVRFWRDAGGATAIEYGLIAVLVFLVAAGGMAYFGAEMQVMYDKVSTAVTSIQ